jgi:hypothetical protein
MASTVFTGVKGTLAIIGNYGKNRYDPRAERIDTHSG